jgi:aryl-alcohol dehydrogenase-like predicted oxidoreductase
MEYFQLVSSDLKISRIGFGCAAISGYDYGKVDERESIKSIRKAWEKGINLFDTADVYGFGNTEKILANALGNERHKAIIATKFGINWDQSGMTYRDCSVKRMIQALEDSMRRLRLDCIPIYMIHWHDGITPLAELMIALKKCQQMGKIKYIGCSNFTPAMVLKALKTHKLDFIQLPYSLVRRENEIQLSESIKKQSMVTIIYDVLARGLLTGKYDKNVKFGKNDTRTNNRYFTGDSFKFGLRMVKRLEIIGRRHDKNPAQVAIKWAIGQSFVNCVLIGSKHVSQVSENTDVFEWSLTREDQAELEQ